LSWPCGPVTNHPTDEERNLESGLSELPIGLDPLVTRLFEVTLAVTACRSLVEPAVTTRLDSVIDMVNKIIRDVRLAIFGAQRQSDAMQAGLADGRPPPIRLDAREAGFSDPSVPPDGVLPLLREVSITVDGLWRSALEGDHPAAAVTLAEASHSLYRAVIALQGYPPAETGRY
jgi:hypothetical protein